jgi:hypothetical protein
MHRQEALDGESEETLYIEMSADPGGDPMDRAQWRIANASYPRRTSERAMLRLRKKLKSLDSWQREALGVWDEEAKFQPAIPSAVWRQLFDVPPDGVKPDCLGVDMSHRGEISVSACWVNGDFAHAEEVWAGVDEAATIEWLDERALRRTPIIIDNASPASALAPELRRRGKNVKLSTAWDMGKACGLVVARAKAGTITHGGQEPVTDALKGARKRPIRDAGGWGWDRRDEAVNIAPLVAWTLAVFGAVSQRRKSNSDGRQAILL